MAELPKRELDYIDNAGLIGGRGKRRQSVGALPDDIEQWEVGALVRHPTYDLGQIQWIRPNGAQTRVGVIFRNGAEKSFILQFADLVRVEFDEID